VVKKTITLLAVAALMTVALSAGSNAGAAKPASGEPIVFGYLDPLVGASATPSVKQALLAYVDDYNERGGHDGQPVEIRFEDVGFDPGKSLAAARTFGSDPGVAGILNLGGICAVTRPVLATFNIPTLVAALDDSCPQDPSFMFTPGQQAATLPMMQFAINEGAKHFGLIYPGGIPLLRTGFVDPLESYLALNPDAGIDVTTVEVPIVATGADFDGAIAKLKAAGVTALYAAAQPAGAALAMQSAIRNGFGPDDGIKWIWGPNIYDPTVVADLPDLEGAYALATATPWEETSNKQVKKMNRIIGDAVEVKDGFAESGYQTGALIEQSLDKVKGAVTRDSLRKVWQSKAFTKYQPALVPYTVNLTDGLKNPAGGQIVLAKGGQWEPASEFIVVPAKEFTE
jgi:branched-chain amino acid transport system substrate-binding protein